MERQGIKREQGWHSGESTRLPPMWPGFDSQIQRHMWVDVVGSLLCTEKFFFGYSDFPLSSRTNRAVYTRENKPRLNLAAAYINTRKELFIRA